MDRLHENPGKNGGQRRWLIPRCQLAVDPREGKLRPKNQNLSRRWQSRPYCHARRTLRLSKLSHLPCPKEIGSVSGISLSQCLPSFSMQSTECCEDTAIQMDPPTLDEIRRAISKLKCGRTSGWDNIGPEMLRCASEPIARGLHVLFWKVWETGQVPAD